MRRILAVVSGLVLTFVVCMGPVQASGFEAGVTFPPSGGSADPVVVDSGSTSVWGGATFVQLPHAVGSDLCLVAFRFSEWSGSPMYWWPDYVDSGHTGPSYPLTYGAPAAGGIDVEGMSWSVQVMTLVGAASATTSNARVTADDMVFGAWAIAALAGCSGVDGLGGVAGSGSGSAGATVADPFGTGLALYFGSYAKNNVDPTVDPSGTGVMTSGHEDRSFGQPDQGWALATSGTFTWGVAGVVYGGLSVIVDGGLVAGGGDCGGVGSLSWGSPGLSSINNPSGGWGNYWDPVSESCTSYSTWDFNYINSLIASGDTVLVSATIGADTVEDTGSVQCQWSDLLGNSLSTTAFYLQVNGGQNFRSYTSTVDAVPGAKGVHCYVNEYTSLKQFSVVDVEGTTSDPGTNPGYDPGSIQSGQGGAEDCTPPDSGDINPIDWTAYGICVMSAWGGLVVRGLSTLATGIGGAVAGAVSSVMQFLFIPTDLTGYVSSELALLGAHTPFVEIGSVLTALGSHGDPGGAMGTLDPTISVGGQSFEIPIATVLTGLAPYRLLFLGILVMPVVSGTIGMAAERFGGPRAPQQLSMNL